MNLASESGKMTEGGGTDPPDRGRKRDVEEAALAATQPLPPESYRYDESNKYLGFKVVIAKENGHASAFAINKCWRDKYTRSEIVLEQFGKRCIAYCGSAKIANDVTTNEQLIASGFTAYIPLYYVATAAIVWNVDTDKTEEWIMNNIEVPGDRRVLKVFRLKRKVMTDAGTPEWIPANRIKIFIEGCGTPQRVFFETITCQANLFVKRYTQCGNCFKFNHTAKKCIRDKICKGCGRFAHDGSCDYIKCAGCGGDSHPTTSPNCSAKIRQRNINHAMATEMLSWDEASRKFPTTPRSNVNTTYASVLNANPFAALTIEDDDFPSLPEASNKQKKHQFFSTTKRKNTSSESRQKMTMKAAKRVRNEQQAASQIESTSMDGVENEFSSQHSTFAEHQEDLQQKLQAARQRLQDNNNSGSGGFTSSQTRQEQFFQKNFLPVTEHGYTHPPPGGSSQGAADGGPI